MATITVGNGKDQATIAAGISAGNTTDTIEIYASTSDGVRKYYENSIIPKADQILKSDTVGQRNTISNTSASQEIFDINNDCTVQDFEMYHADDGGRQGFQLSDVTVTLNISNCIYFCGARFIDLQSDGGSTVNVSNCICIGSNLFIAAGSAAGAVISVFHSAAIYCRTGESISGGSLIFKNCLFWYNNTDGNMINVTGDYNATTESSGVPGANSVYDLTINQARLVYYFETRFPIDFRNLDGGSSSLEDAGVQISTANGDAINVTLDMDGNTRSTTVPNIGPSETLLQISESVNAPTAPTLTAAVGDEQLVITIDGAAGATNEVFYRIKNTTDAGTSGGTRSGDGDITIASLINLTTYEIWAQSNTVSNQYSISSGSVFAEPSDGTGVGSTNFLSNAIILIRDKLKTNITDPISSIRPATEKFVMTSYPKRNVTYPIITVTDRGIIQPQRLGMASEGTVLTIDIEVRIWARNVVERDELTQQVYDYLRTNQLDATTGLSNSNLHDFSLQSAVNVEEGGEAGIQSKVCEYRFLLVIS